MRMNPFFEDVAAIGKKMSLHILGMEKLSADFNIASRLMISVGSPVLRIESIRKAEGISCLYRVSYYPLNLVPNIQSNIHDDVPAFESLKMSLPEGLFIQTSKQTFRVVLAEKPISEYLEVPDGTPLILWKGVNFLNDGSPIEYSIAQHDSHSFVFSVEQSRNQ